MKKIMFTGGGSAGHVTVNLALIPRFQEEGWSVDYVGSEAGIERQLAGSLPEVRYHGIATGKLRRYFSWQNVKDPFKVVKGAFQAYNLIRKEKPDVLFSKGGFVSVPVVLGAWLNRVPVLLHESDLTPGLANKIAIRFATGVCTTFPETEAHMRGGKAHHVGAVIREELLQGDAARGRAFCGFTAVRPVLLIMGGSLGARRINQTVRSLLDELTKTFQIVHLCGKGNVDPSLERPGYMQFEYVQQELPDLVASADIVLSRAGSNSIFEFLALRKPMLLIPLSRQQSRGDQILNAKSFQAAGFCEVLEEEELTEQALLQKLSLLYENREQYKANMRKSEMNDALTAVFELIKKTASK
ncbi:UDP-N-acetylglucosamine--N-acetylmuramyl-(pentapeptide) pyrophosphoryl-undecaprenol N-acetylglucosamine transferase [Paenibacillus phyllosphaerae]|uniref:UDP-N-acetylglucosamine--N-acetylmuramyl-(pentapeptide) pyrophosphoryl-undecaprenol N-acetylglucosamine transferase n=1 Tax=Paenibacillus phyllosphaerae TaxID=274593 RepID=A0A7W5B0I0_9BACL|nr:undecaprenyldiphospho-muramoylpentapeptide beta-N-acetylglucosaminyltransferase [Paenibacillus phyllosphaerae]MBB3112215.1 UDP-N-acetylglucosamine--N-acetylmuramyl-(pentapeptide) pyrophosphoryl-undecaprenol N-acetylglucosamine transferase [Paenibacillus phyllosphaerae]